MIKTEDIIKLKDYIIYFEIGKGGQSKVYYAIDKKNNSPVAIKVSKGEQFEEIFQKEVSFVSENLNRFIIKSKTTLKKELIFGKKSQICYYVMELADNGSLHDFISGENGIIGFPEYVIRYYIEQLIEGIEFVAGKGYCHSD